MNAKENQTTIRQFTVLKRAVIYARVSTDEQAETGTSLDNQVEQSLAYAQANNLSVVDIFKEDFTGKVLDRPELNKVRAMLRSRQFDCLIVYKTNRLDRSEWGVNLLILLQELKEAGVELHYSRDKRQIDLTNPVEALMESIKGWQAGEDHRETVEKLYEGRVNKVKSGSVMITGVPPFGYRKIKVGKKHKLEIDPIEAEVVKLIFHLYAIEGLTIYGIAQQLNEMGIETPAQRGRSKRKSGPVATEWVQSTISNMLRRETYIGTWRYGKTKVINGQQKRIKTHNSDLKVTVPAIIEPNIWKAAQVKLSENQEKAKRNKKYEYLLSGRCTCGKCGRKMGGRSRKEYKAKNLKSYFYYYCAAPDCEMTYFRARPVEDAVWKWLVDIFMDDEKLQSGIKEYLAAMSQQNNPIEREIEIVNNLLSQHNIDLDNALLDLKAAKSPRAKARIADDIARLEKQLDGLEQRKKDLQNRLKTVKLTDEQIISLKEFAASIQKDLATIQGDFESRQELLELLDLQITLDIVNYKRQGFVTCKIGRSENLPIRYILF